MVFIKSKLFQILLISAYAILPILAVLTEAEENKNQNIIIEKDFFVTGGHQTEEVSIFPYLIVESEILYVPLEVFSDFKVGDTFNDQNYSLSPNAEFGFNGTIKEFLEQANSF